MNCPIYLVNATRKTNQVHFPMGLSVLANSLKMHGIEPRVIDLMPIDVDKRVEYFKSKLPDEPAIYGFGIIAGNHQIEEVEMCAAILLEKNPQNIIVYGGPLPTAVPAVIIGHCLCRYVLAGEGEFSLPRLVRALREGDLYPKDIPGLYYKENGTVFGVPPKRIKQLDRHSNPDYSLFDLDFYVQYLEETGQSFEVMSSRGCHGLCTFCYKFMGHGISSRTVDDVLDEIEFVMKRCAMKKFYIVDENFLEARLRFLEFCRRKKERDMAFTFIIQARIDSIDKECCEVGAQNGLRGISTGLEAVSQETLDKVKKSITLDEMQAKLELMRKNNIEITANFIIGFPWETEAYYEELISFIQKHGLEKRIKLSYLTPLPGSHIYREATSSGLIKDEFTYIKSLGDLYWEQLVNFTSMPNEMLDHYYEKINRIGQRDVVYPQSKVFKDQIKKIH